MFHSILTYVNNYCIINFIIKMINRKQQHVRTGGLDKALDQTGRRKPRQIAMTQMPHQKLRCHRCLGSGRAPCQICRGRGEDIVGYDLNGQPRLQTCSGCYGTRTRLCSYCGGEGEA